MKLADKINEVIENLELNIDAYDIYSCFAAVKMSMESLSIDTNENLTVTGAMPYAGGPLNSYVIHSSVEMIRRIRDKISIRDGNRYFRNDDKAIILRLGQ